MKQYWIAIFATFVFVPLGSAKEEELYATLNSNWGWDMNKSKIIEHVAGVRSN